MLAAAFIIVWVVVGLVLFFVAMSGGPRGARATLQTQNRTGRRIVLAGIVVVYLGAGIAVPALVLFDNPDVARSAPGGIELTKNEAEARETFAITCGQCHTLKAAETVGMVGPNLDELRPPAALVLSAVLEGRVRGNGTMPAGLLAGEEARDVAQFVAAATGASTELPPPSEDATSGEGGSVSGSGSQGGGEAAPEAGGPPEGESGQDGEDPEAQEGQGGDSPASRSGGTGGAAQDQ